MKAPFPCEKCGSRNCKLEPIRGSGSDNFFVNLLEKFLPGANFSPGKLQGGQYRYVCKDCGADGMIIIN